MTISNTSNSVNNYEPSTSPANLLQATCDTFLRQMGAIYKYTLYDHPKTQTLLNNPSLSAKLKYNILYAGLTKSNGTSDPQFDTINLNGEELAKIFTLLVDYVAHCKNNSLTREVQGFGIFKEKMIKLIALLSHSNPDKYAEALGEIELQKNNPAIATAIADIKTQVIGSSNNGRLPNQTITPLFQGHPTDEVISIMTRLSDTTNNTSQRAYLDQRLNDHSTRLAIERAESIEISAASPLSPPSSNSFNTHIEVVDADTITAVKKLQKLTGSNPQDNVCVLNMANPFTIGEGVQERTIHENTNYGFAALKFSDSNFTKYHENYSLINSRRLRQIYASGITLYDNNTKIAVISAAADLREISFKDSHFPTIIRGILLTAANKGHINLVLGAIGCGKKNIMKWQIANLFKNYLNTEFKGIFKNVVFAILDAETTDIFKQIIEPKAPSVSNLYAPSFLPGGNPTEKVLDRLKSMTGWQIPYNEASYYRKCFSDQYTYLALENARFIDVKKNAPLLNFTTRTANPTAIKVVQDTTSNAIQNLQRTNQGRKVCVLFRYPESSAVKDNLRNCTNIYALLLKYSDIDEYDNWHPAYKDYLLIDGNGRLRQFYSPYVTLFSNNSKIAVIIASEDDRKIPTEESHFPDIIRGILRSALQLGHKDLVLEAIGCGQNHVDKQKIANFFKYYLENEFKDVFENVTFAITDAPTANIFKATLESTAGPVILEHTAGSATTSAASTSSVNTSDKLNEKIDLAIQVIITRSRWEATPSNVKKALNRMINSSNEARTRQAISTAQSITVNPNFDYPSTGVRYNTKIEIMQKPTTDVIEQLHASGADQIGVLSMADSSTAGGAFLQGNTNNQETSLCHSSNVYATLLRFCDLRFGSVPQFDKYTKDHALIALDGTPRQIFSPDVTFFPPNSDEGFKISVISANANPSNLQIVIKGILDTAVKNNLENLVLGAIGCGSMGVQPFRCAQEFNKLLNGHYKGVFKTVTFAIFDQQTADIFKNTIKSPTD